MNIIFYVEPLSFHNDLCHYWKWLERMTHIYTTLFVGTTFEGDYRFVTNEGLAWEAKTKHRLFEDKIIALKQVDLRKRLPYSNMDIIKKIHHRDLNSEETESLKVLYHQKLGDFIPDVILTYSPAQFFEDIYPGCLVLHMENGPFSRHPFPETTYFDPLGLYQSSLFEANHKELQQMKAKKEDIALLEAFREPYHDLLKAKSPFHALESKLRKKFRKLILVPLQTSHTMYYDLNGPFNTQGEFLFDLIEKTPKDIALILSFHNIALYLNDMLREGTLEYLAQNHENVIIDDHITNVCTASQYLIHHVDAIISISSSVALQALLWNVPVINIGESHLRHICTHDSIESYGEDETKTVDYDGALAWLFRHYYPIAEYSLYNSHWLTNFLQRSLAHKKEGKLGLDFYAPIDTDANLIAKLHSPKQIANRKKIPTFERGYSQIVGAPITTSYKDKQAHNLVLNGDFSYPKSIIDNIDPFLICPRWKLIGNLHERLKISSTTLENSHEYPEDTLKNILSVKSTGRLDEYFMLIHKIFASENFIGKKVIISFWARGNPGSFFALRQYFQFPTQPHFNVGTNAATVLPIETWQYYEQEVQMPNLPTGAKLTPDCFMEFVVELPYVIENTQLEMTGFAFVPAHLLLPYSESLDKQNQSQTIGIE